MMKEADVFQIGDEAQLYVVETVAASGTVYARRFDVQGGPYGEPLAFQANTNFKVLFSDLPPEPEEGWEYCEISHVVVGSSASGPAYECFVAEIIGAESNTTIATSDKKSIGREPNLTDYSEESGRKVHQKLINKLLRQGWEIEPDRRRAWYSPRLKRKLGAQPSSAESERPGCLASLFGRRN